MGFCYFHPITACSLGAVIIDSVTSAFVLSAVFIKIALPVLWKYAKVSTEILRFEQRVLSIIGVLIMSVLNAEFPIQRTERVASSMQICYLHLSFCCIGGAWC